MSAVALADFSVGSSLCHRWIRVDIDGSPITCRAHSSEAGLAVFSHMGIAVFVLGTDLYLRAPLLYGFEHGLSLPSPHTHIPKACQEETNVMTSFSASFSSNFICYDNGKIPWTR